MILKEYARNFLSGAGIYQRAKASWVYDFYWSLTDSQILDDRRREIEFYRNLLDGFREGDLIFDIGANQGYKTDMFLKLGARVIGVEPDETSLEILRQKFLTFRVKKKPLLLVGKAVSDKSSTQTMWIETPGSAKNTLSQKWTEMLSSDDRRFGHTLSFEQRKEVETVSIEQLIAVHGLPFFVKIDVEGHELNVLLGLKQRVPYLSFEVNLPEFKPEGLQCIETLGRLASDGKFNYAADCRRGLTLERWLGPEEFADVFNSCADESIEIFWKTSVSNK